MDFTKEITQSMLFGVVIAVVIIICALIAIALINMVLSKHVDGYKQEKGIAYGIVILLGVFAMVMNVDKVHDDYTYYNSLKNFDGKIEKAYYLYNMDEDVKHKPKDVIKVIEVKNKDGEELTLYADSKAVPDSINKGETMKGIYSKAETKEDNVIGKIEKYTTR